MIFFRLAFASLVFLAHVGVLSAHPDLAMLVRWCDSALAVQGFFIISGFLIAQSWDRAPDMRTYAAKRFRRIFPAYGVVIVGSVCLGAFFYQGEGGYWGEEVWRYLIANLLFLNFVQPTLPGLFEGNSFTAVNGALWTLKIEVMFYAVLPLLWWGVRRWPVASLLGMYVASTLYHVMLSETHGELSRQLPGQLRYFVGGMAVYAFLPLFRQHVLSLVFASAVVWWWSDVIGLAVWVQPACLAVLVLAFALAVPYLGSWARYGDVSYGIYILHFPLLQTMIALGFFTLHPWRDVVIAAATLLLLAYGMWHVVEKHFLRRKHPAV